MCVTLAYVVCVLATNAQLTPDKPLVMNFLLFRASLYALATEFISLKAAYVERNKFLYVFVV